MNSFLSQQIKEILRISVDHRSDVEEQYILEDCTLNFRDVKTRLNNKGKLNNKSFKVLT
jgi:hypothetical protein